MNHCGCVDWMSYDERKQMDIKNTMDEIKNIWLLLYPDTRPTMEWEDGDWRNGHYWVADNRYRGNRRKRTIAP